VDPAAAKDRYEQKLLEARVICEPTEAGTANLMGLDLPPDEANRAMRHINRKAKRLKAGGDKRPIDLIRAELFLALLNGTHQGKASDGGDRAQVNLNAELTTVLGLDDQPGEIPGWGPVIADIARQIVTDQPDADWNIPITHLQEVIDLVTTRRRPTRAQQRVVQILKPDCGFPTCRNDANNCDIDHVIPWQQTKHTTIRELQPLCPHHNQVKEHGWKTQPNPDGTHTWTSPFGHTYTIQPTGPDPP
jgi:hypothetical protein